MAKIVEVPNIGNVEFPDEMSDDQIADAIKQQMPQEQQGPVVPGTGSDVGNMAAAAAGGSVLHNALTNPPTTAPIAQAAQTAKTIASPAVSGAMQSGADLAKTYIRNPGTAAADLVASHMGLPPPVATAKAQPFLQGIQQTYQQAKDYVNKTGQFTEPATTASQQMSAQMADQAAKEDALHSALFDHSLKQSNPAKVAQDTAGMSYEQKLNYAKANNVKMPSMLTAEAEAMAAPSSANFLARVSTMAGKYLPVAMVAHELMYTSPEEVATLKAAEAKRRAQGWKPLNER
jgi:hypothetical protein